LLVSGFGGGKTTTGCIEMIISMLSIPNNYGIIGRKDLGELRSTTLKDFFDLCPKELITEHNRQEKFIRFVNGSEMFYMNLDDSREASDKIKSMNLGCAYIDQLEEIEESVFLAIIGRLRRNGTNRNFWGSANTNGHDWLWKRWKEMPFEDYVRSVKIPLKSAYKIVDFIDNHGEVFLDILVERLSKRLKYPPEIIKNLYLKSSYALFELSTLDNIYLPRDYINQLLTYPPRWVNRYVFNSWEEFEGLVFDEYLESRNKIDLYEPSETEQHYIILDYGYKNPTAIVFASTDYDGITRVYDVYYESGKLVSEISQCIKKNKFFTRAIKLIDPSAYRSERDGSSVANEFRDNGIYFRKADNNVLQGINRVNEYFKSARLLVCKNCIDVFKELSNYRWREIKISQDRNEYEEPIKKDDHLMDCLRYLVNEIYTPVAPTKPLTQEELYRYMRSRQACKNVIKTKPYSNVATF